MAKLKAHAADRLDPARCIAIEDSHWGIEAARAAGLRCVAVTSTYPAADLGQADLIVDRLASVTLPVVEHLIAGS